MDDLAKAFEEHIETLNKLLETIKVTRKIADEALAKMEAIMDNSHLKTSITMTNQAGGITKVHDTENFLKH
jgi:hypothetical protein